MSKPIFKEDVLILHSADEVKLPYESTLTPLGKKIHWFDQLDKITHLDGKIDPLAIVVDIDLLSKPLDPHFEALRTRFPSSDFVALSSSDSAHLAVQCFGAGFVDFLLKPTSPEELAWCIKKCVQRHEAYKKLEDPKSSLVRAVTQISACTTPTLVRLYTVEFLYHLLRCKGAAWVTKKEREFSLAQIQGSTTGEKQQHVALNLPPVNLWKNGSPPLITVGKKTKERKVFLPIKDAHEGVLLWGIPKRPTRREMSAALTLVEHAGLSLLNIQKFEEIKQQTFVDDLTGLYNSRYLKFALSNAILKCKGPEDHFSILFIDVDRFKGINDSHGHVVGSEFLIAIGRTVRNAVRNIDPVFRYGGDEFVVILHGTPTSGALEIAERIRKNIERRFYLIKNQRLQTTVSIGVATFPDHAKDQETVLRLADEAMYSAKKQSRNAVHLAYGLNDQAPLKKAVGE